MAADIVFCSVEHALAYVAIQIWVVVIYYPLSLGYRLRVCEGMVVGGNQLVWFRDVLPVDILGYGAEGDYWAREQQELIDGRRGIADERICHQLIFGYVLSLVDEENILLVCCPFTVFIYPFLAGKRMELHYYQGIALLSQFAQLFLDVRKRSEFWREGRSVKDQGLLAAFPEQFLSVGIIFMQVFLDPILLRPSRFQHLEISISLSQSLEVGSEVRTLGEIGVKVTADNPVVFLLCGIAVEYLYLDTWQIVRHNVAWHIDSFWLEVIDFLNRVGPFHLVGVWKTVYLWFVDIPQYLVWQMLLCHMFLYRIKYVYGILVFTEKNYSHDSLGITLPFLISYRLSNSSRVRFHLLCVHK